MRLIPILMSVAIVATSAAASIDSLKIKTSSGYTFFRLPVLKIKKLVFTDNVVKIDTGAVDPSEFIQRPIGGNGIGLAQFLFDSASTSAARYPLSPRLNYSSATIVYQPSGATISFTLQTSGNFKIDVHNSQGKRVRELCALGLSKGIHSIAWDKTTASGELVSPGIYHVVATLDRTPAFIAKLIVR